LTVAFHPAALPSQRASSVDRPKEVFATSEVIVDLIRYWDILSFFALKIVSGEQQESEDSSIGMIPMAMVTSTVPCVRAASTGRFRARMTIDSLSFFINQFTKRIDLFGRDLYLWFDSATLWDFWDELELWNRDRTQDRSQKVRSRHIRASNDLSRLDCAAKRDWPANPYPPDKYTLSELPFFRLGELRGEPIVNGKVKKRLTPGEHKTVKALFDAGKDGLSLEDLVKMSGVQTADRKLINLKKSDPDWCVVLILQGRWKGYRLDPRCFA
jgi:hypothetical protein